MNYKDYFKRVKNSIQKNSNESTDNEDFEKKYANLKKDFDELYTVKSKLKEDLFKLVDKYRKLEGEYDNLSNVKNQLKKDNVELGQKYTRLSDESKKQINTLIRKDTYQNIAIQSLLKENAILQNIGGELNNFSCIPFDDLTIVIPYKESQDSRKINLRIVLDYLVHIKMKNVIISEEYDYEPSTDWVLDEYDDKFSFIKVISIKTEGLFSRSNLINNGVEESTTPFICIQDGDVVLPKDMYEYSLSLLDSGFDLVYPFNRKVNQILDKQSFINDFDFENTPIKSEFRPNSDGGMQFINKESFLKIGGYNTDFKGWGSEDNEFILRVISADLRYIRLNNSLYHLKHEKDKTTKNNDDILIKSYSIYNDTNDINALINQNEYLMKTALKYDEKYDKFHNVVSFNYKVSIILPLRNPTKFLLERAIKSLMDQTLGFTSLEIIIIDNCSNEYSSIDLIESLTKKYGNIRSVVLDKKIGFDEIYNIAKKEPSTDYVMFLNYKNYLISDACEILYNQMLNDDDMVFGDNVNLVKNKKIKKLGNIISNKNFAQTKSFKLDSICDEIQLVDNDLLMGTKMFKKSFLLKNNFKLSSSVSNQIKFLISKLLFNANGICILGMPVLVYDNHRENSENISSLSYEFIVKNLEDSFEFLKQYYYLFYEFSPENVHVPLNSLSHWIDNDLISAKLKQGDFEDIATEISFFVNEFLKNESTTKPKNYTYEYLYRYIAERDFSRAYEVYEVLC